MNRVLTRLLPGRRNHLSVKKTVKKDSHQIKALLKPISQRICVKT